MFFWMRKKKEIKKDTPGNELHFFCPKCESLTPYRLKPASVDFTFYYVPLFEIRNLHEFVVCQVCNKGFDPNILSPGNQSILKLVWATKCQLSRFPPETLKSKLLGDGLKEPLIDKLITLARN